MNLHKSITDLLYKSYELIDIDYRESLNGHETEINDAISEQSWEPLDSLLESWNLWERELDSIDYILDELTGEIESEFDVSRERAESFVEKYEEWIKEEIYYRDTSTPLHDLLRNTDEPIFYYETGLEIPQTWNFDDKELKDYIKEIKRTLKIKIKDSTYDRELTELLVNASYGGELLIFFKGDIDELVTLKQNGYKRVKFENMEVGLIDYMNGSGHNVTLNGAKLSLPLDVEKIYLDKMHRYDYTDSVCGMVHSWCDSTRVKFSRR